MISHNGTNFICDSNELRELGSKIEKANVKSLAPKKGINRGVLERMINEAKRAIKAMLGNTDFMTSS